MGQEVEVPVDREVDVLIAISSEIQTELRARRESEHLYTAAFVGASGAVAWGAATIAAIPSRTFTWIHPALAGLIFIALMAVVISLKTLREHAVHRDLRAQGDKIGATLLAKSAGLAAGWPNHLQASDKKKTVTGLMKITGAAYSLAVICATAFGAGMFCLSVYWSH